MYYVIQNASRAEPTIPMDVTGNPRERESRRETGKRAYTPGNALAGEGDPYA